MFDRSAPAQPSETDPSVLEGWKAIATYLNRDVRTAKRWEVNEGLPVHRLQHLARSSVYAYPAELDAWKRKRQPDSKQPELRLPSRDRRALIVAPFAGLLLLTTSASPIVGPASIEAQAALTTTRLWSSNSIPINASFSPDGRWLAYSDYDASGNANITLRDTSTGATRQLTQGTGGVEASSMKFSRDGRRVAFMWDGPAESGLYVIGVDGSSRRRLGKSEMNLDLPYDWSPDGKLVSVNLYESGQSRLALLATDDGKLTTLKSTGWRKALGATFSLDGKYLAYSVVKTSNDPDHGIFLLAVDGSGETRLADGSSPVWTPDGRGIVFSTDRSGTTDLWYLSILNGRPQGDPRPLDAGKNAPVVFQFGLDGSAFYQVSNVLNDVFVAPFDSRTLQPAAPTRVSENGVGSNHTPSWSPDGKLIAMFRGNDRRSVKLVIRTVATAEERTLATTLEDGQWARTHGTRWFPDGRSILTQDLVNYRRAFKKIDVETGDQKTVFDPPFAGSTHQFALSSNGRDLFFVARENGEERLVLRLMKRDLETGAQTELIRTEGTPAEWDAASSKYLAGIAKLPLSPDEEFIAFVVRRDSSLVLLAVPTAGGSAREIYRSGPTRLMPAPVTWTPDGRHLLGVVDEGESDGLWAVPVSGGTPTRVVGSWRNSRPVFSPDGTSMLFSRRTVSAEFYVVRNLLSQLDARR